MKTKLMVTSSFLLALTAGSAFAAADSSDVFVKGTLQGQWKPAASSVSNDKPSVDISLAVYGAMITGKSVRVTEATRDKPIGTEVASQLFTHQFQN